MRDKRAHIELTGEDEARDFALDGKISRVAADEVFFIQANGGEVQWKVITGFGGAFCVREEEDLAAAANELDRLTDGVVRRDGDDGGVEGLRTAREYARPTIFFAQIQCPFGAEFFGKFEAGFEEVGSQDVDAAQFQ